MIGENAWSAVKVLWDGRKSFNMWVNVKTSAVPKEGKYVVKTSRPHPALPGRTLEQKVEALMTIKIDSKGKECAIWHVSNQVVTHYLLEA